MSSPVAAGPAPVIRQRLRIEGLVQGVGFRPFVHRLACEAALTGWVGNSGAGVTVEIEGPGGALKTFRTRLRTELPPLARLDKVHAETTDSLGGAGFSIKSSADAGAPTALVLPDMATCADCLSEIRDAADRRYRYPFTNCTNCGPRFSITQALPYDRANTTMRGFDMCPECRSEYGNPADRRFHAQPNACPECGPQLTLTDAEGAPLATRDRALRKAAEALRAGKIVALMGLGGFQLLADAGNAMAVCDLRRRKRRPDKPFAIMFPTLADIEARCDVSEAERAALTAQQAPIVLLMRRSARPGAEAGALAAAVAPGNPMLGAMLPTTPLHHVLMADLGCPVVATSGNLSGEPMVRTPEEALKRLGNIADVFLCHDRPIATAVDDSVVRVIDGQARTLRCARGYAPLPVPVHRKLAPVLALGGHMKSAVAATLGSQVLLGPHIGDLDGPAARRAHASSVRHVSGLYRQPPSTVACDTHPDYHTSHIAARFAGAPVAVPHHLAHIVACMAENGVEGPVLGVAWDGTGHGGDGTIWGGEFIRVDGTTARRVAHLHPFRLPGGEKAMREPRRAAIGLLHELSGNAALSDGTLPPVASFAPGDLALLQRMLARGLNAPVTTSAGRLFDGVAALAGLVQQSSFEGQAAMALEFAAMTCEQAQGQALGQTPDQTPEQTQGWGAPADLVKGDGQMIILDWRPLLRSVLADLQQGRAVGAIAAAFHDALAAAIVAVARRIGEPDVVLTGGCFQNARLSESAAEGLRRAGLRPILHRAVPPNDGALALGQAVWAARLLEKPGQLEKGMI